MFVKEKAAGEVKELSNAARACRKAAVLIEKHGICYSIARGRDGSICTGRAVADALDILKLPMELYGSIDATFRSFIGQRIVAWNDWTRPTTAESAAMLRYIATKV